MTLVFIQHSNLHILPVIRSGIATISVVFFLILPTIIYGQNEGGYGSSESKSTVQNNGLNGQDYGLLFLNGNGRSDNGEVAFHFLLNGEYENTLYTGGMGRSDQAKIVSHFLLEGSNLQQVYFGGNGKSDVANLQRNFILTGLDARSVFIGGRGRADHSETKMEVQLNGNYRGALALGGNGRNDAGQPKFAVSLTGEELIGPNKGGSGRSDATNIPFAQILNESQFEPYLEILGACDMARLVLISPVIGTTHQWQFSTDSFASYSDVIDNDYFADATSSTLFLTGIPSSYSGFQFRCVVDGLPTSMILLRFTLYWQGDENVDWHLGTNWNCDHIPDIYSEVTIHGAGIINFPELSRDGICKTLTQMAGGLITIKSNHTLTVAGPQ